MAIPTSSSLVSAVVDAFQLRNALKPGAGLSIKTLDRYFGGDRILPRHLRSVVKALVGGVLSVGALPPSASGALNLLSRASDSAPSAPLVEGLLDLLEFWDHFAGELRTAAAVVTDPAVAALPVARLAVIELAVRVGALQFLADRSAAEDLRAPSWATLPPRWMAGSTSRMLRVVLRWAGLRETAAIAKAIGVNEKTARGWLDDVAPARPVRDHLHLLADEVGDRRPDLERDSVLASRRPLCAR